uniref:Response regulatory domain-containing protein n=1 Tax=Odontella aurita TaxID=265563 RepID=A0A7S4ID55_9STRA|mmetsp:Transcript_23414/g.69291  ORF Transcript_23414/g.69291 Transcript_23414/m.69291 type:complete len:1740 (+) Transcript_23414:1637-6856(+)
MPPARGRRSGRGAALHPGGEGGGGCRGEFCDLARALDPRLDLLLPSSSAGGSSADPLDDDDGIDGGGDDAERRRSRGEGGRGRAVGDAIAGVGVGSDDRGKNHGRRGKTRRIGADDASSRARSRALRLLRPILTPAELTSLDESGKLKCLRVARPLNPFRWERTGRDDVELARREWRGMLLGLSRAEDAAGLSKGEDGGEEGDGTAGMSEEEWREMAEAHWGRDGDETKGCEDDDGNGDRIGCNVKGTTVRVCGVCCEAYCLLGRVRSLLSEEVANNEHSGVFGLVEETLLDATYLGANDGEDGARPQSGSEDTPDAADENVRPSNNAIRIAPAPSSSMPPAKLSKRRDDPAAVVPGVNGSPAKSRPATAVASKASPYKSARRRPRPRKAVQGAAESFSSSAGSGGPARETRRGGKESNGAVSGAGTSPQAEAADARRRVPRAKVLVADGDLFVLAQIRRAMEEGGEDVDDDGGEGGRKYYDVTTVRDGYGCKRLLLGDDGPSRNADACGEGSTEDGKGEDQGHGGCPYDAILIDRNLNGADAFEMTEWLRSLRSASRSAADDGASDAAAAFVLPQIVVLTDEVSSQALRSYAEAGMDGCLPKPVEEDRLLGTVRKAVEVSRRRRAAAEIKTKKQAGGQHRQNQRTNKRIGPRGNGAPPTGTKKKGKLSVVDRHVTAKAMKEMMAPPKVKAPAVPMAVPQRDDPNVIEGVLRFDDDTTFPYMILDSGRRRRRVDTNTKKRTQNPEEKSKFFNLVVCHDLFDTHERLRIMLAPLAKRYPGMQILLWNYPGQAYTTFPDEGAGAGGSAAKGGGRVLNNAFHAECLAKLMGHVCGVEEGGDGNNKGKDGGGDKAGIGGNDDDEGRSAFNPTRPYYLLGYGSGGAVAAYYASRHHSRHHGRPSCQGPEGQGSSSISPRSAPSSFGRPLLRGLLLLNSLSHVDPHYAACLHDCRNVFACSPASRPDLPVYFYSRYLFSPRYLKRTTAPVALNLYSAVHNPITLRGRGALCLGALNHVDLRGEVLGGISAPIVAVYGKDAALIRPLHAKSYVEGRRTCGSIHDTLKGGSRTVVLTMGGGHELWQERRNDVVGLVEQLAMGYHEGNRGEVPWRSNPSPEDAGVDGDDGEEDPAAEIVGNNGNMRTFEDKFVDAIVGKGNAGKAGAGISSGFSHIQRMAEVTRGPAPAGNDSWDEYRDKLGSTVTKTLGGGPASAKALSRSKSTPKPNNLGKPKQFKSKSTKPSVNESFARLIDPTNPAFERQSNNVYAPGKGSLVYPDPAEYPEVSEYMSWRLKRNRKRLARLEYAARVIQCALRAFMARTMVIRLRRHAMAGEIQRIYRGRMGRKLFMQRRKELWAALFTQRAIRGMLGRSDAHRRRLRRESQIRLARRWRGIKARMLVFALIAARNRAVTMFQCLWRIVVAKGIAREHRRRRAASTVIQRVYRGQLGRKAAERERDKYLFSRSQSSGIELGRQMLSEHKLHASKLSSEICILNQERKAAEEEVDQLLEEISQFEDGVRTLEGEMHLLSKAERENASTLRGKLKHQLREQKIRLDQQFSSTLAKIADRKDRLKSLETKLSNLGRTRQTKNEELKALERKLVVLLEAQESQLAEIRRKQEDKRNAVLSNNGLTPTKSASTSGGANAAAASQQGYCGPTEIEKKQAAKLMESTETMMKFGFMSMSMTYFSSLNMVSAMKKVAAQDTVMAAVAHGDDAANGVQPSYPRGREVAAPRPDVDFVSRALGE